MPHLELWHLLPSKERAVIGTGHNGSYPEKQSKADLEHDFHGRGFRVDACPEDRCIRWDAEFQWRDWKVFFRTASKSISILFL